MVNLILWILYIIVALIIAAVYHAIMIIIGRFYYLYREKNCSYKELLFVSLLWPVSSFYILALLAKDGLNWYLIKIYQILTMKYD